MNHMKRQEERILNTISPNMDGLTHLPHDKLVLVGVERRLVHLYSILLQHVKESSLARIVQPQEKNLCALVVEPWEY